MRTPVPAIHTEQHTHSSNFIKDVVIGMSDGLTVPFALAAGLTGAVSQSSLIVIAGLAEIAAGSIAMGLGGYLAGKTEQDYYESERRREETEVETVPEMEKAEVRNFFRSIGLSTEVQDMATEEIAKDKKQWIDFMMKFELGLDEPNPKRATKSALNIGGSYAVGGLIPLFPYFIIPDSQQAIVYSIIAALISLFVFGYFKSKATGVPVFSGAIKIVLIGAVAAGSAFLIAKLLQ
ncbi:MAG: VIT1/CCC1 transporter family protein [Chitinophagaceae bacterium]|nr:VIT1/CCC1 transporter family protein [Chitinophagaceae bacterium]